jgi:hypothetical protein
MQMQGGFNANQYEPKQSGGGHPPALKIPFTITNTGIKENASKDGGFFEVEFTSQLGSIIHRYNVWNKSPKAVEISYGQLSALCRAVNIYQLDWQNEGAALRGGKGLMDVGYQKGEEPSPENPDAKGYTELKRVYDMAGNEPGKSAPQQQPQTMQQPQQNGPAPMQQQPGGGWGQPSQPQQQAPQQQQPQGQAWQPGGGNQQSPPWGNRT